MSTCKSRKCLVCKTPFIVTPCHFETAKYCSVECQKKGQRKGKDINCRTCKKSFYISKCQIGKIHYCSKDCRSKKPKPGNTIKCDGCKKDFFKPAHKKVTEVNYCNTACQANGKEVECKACGTKIYRTRNQLDIANNSFCDRACLGNYQSGNKKEGKIECITCRTPFQENGDEKYCSKKCNPKKIFKTVCQNCKKTFDRDQSAVTRGQKCCSFKCSGEIKRARVELNCLHCKQPFEVTKSLSTRTKYCSKDCKDKGAVNKMPSFPYVRKKMKREGKVEKCNRCGYKRSLFILGLHHIDHDPKNNLEENMEVLCPNCHSEHHARHIVHGSRH